METNLDLISLLRSFEKDSTDMKGSGIQSMNIDKTRFILKIQPNSVKSKDFAITLADHCTQQQHILKHASNKQLNATDELCKGLFDIAEDTLRNSIDANIRNIMSQNFEEKLDSEAIHDLQNEFLTEGNDGVCNDFRLIQQNSIGSNFHFNALNGNFEELISGPLLPGTKDFSLERSHDLPGKQKHAMQKFRSKHFTKGQSENENIEKTLEKWDQILSTNTQNDEGSIFTNETIPKINTKAEAILSIINQKDMILQGQDSAKPPTHYNTLWNIFSEHFEEKSKVVEPEKPFISQIDFEGELDIGHDIPESQKENVIADVQGEQIKLLSQFEKILEEPAPKAKPTANKASPTKQLTTQYEWAVQDESDLTHFYDALPKSRFAIQYPFELDDFQKRAVLHLENKESVFVAAHTSAGKTVVAEYAIALCKKHMTRAIYTSPIKALSNQKYRDFLTKFDSVGILTGDVTLKPEASCLIVTTEVLRSMLYKGSDTIRDIEWVIFDEVHYVNDIERGVVWEETIIMLPEHIGIIMLSATVPNAMDFANWVGQTKRRKIFVQTTYKRPTPLEHSIYINGEFKVIKSKEGEFMQNEYEKFLQKIAKAKKDQDELREKRKNDLLEKFEENDWDFKDKKKKKFQQREKLKKEQRNFNNPSEGGGKDTKLKKEQNQFYELIRHCAKENLLPCVFFAFSKKKCMELANGLKNLSLCTREERNKIIVFFNDSIKRLKPVDRDLPQLENLGKLLQQGIAVHHGDLLPIAKEIVEILFADGLIKVLFATETFAMGVNMPAKTVIFCGLRKNDGKEFRYLKSNEYTQMSGRAGRRGLDDKGNVILFVKDKMELPPLYDLKKIIDQKGELLESKFRLTYGTIFNLLLAKELKVVDVMQRSFSQHGKVASLPSQQKKLKAYKKQKELIQKNLECYLDPLAKEIPIYGFTSTLDTIKKSSEELWTHPAVINNLSLPKAAIILGQNGEFDVAVIIGCENVNDKIIYKTFVPDLQNRSQKKKIEISYEENYKSGLRYGSDLINNTKYNIYNLNPSHIIQIMDTPVKISKVEKELTYKQKETLIEMIREEKGQILREKKDNSFLAFNIGRVPNADPKILDLFRNIRSMMEKLAKHICHTCDYKSSHLDVVRRLKFLQDDIQLLSQDQREDNLAFSDEFDARTRILQKMSYLDENQIPLIKARVGRELGSSDIFLCEVVMENILDELPPQEVAALLSSFICQIKKSEVDNNDLVPDSLKGAIEKVQRICTNIIDLETKYNIIVEDEEEYLKEKVNFALIKVVYEWACQKDFAEICQLTDVQEGSIVRTILRLEILMRDLRNACKVMGNMKLHQLLEDASHLIRRDIVFAGSLYLE